MENLWDSKHPEPNQFLIHPAKYVPGRSVFFPMNKDKIRKEIIFEIIHCFFESQAELHHQIQSEKPEIGAS